MKNKMKVAACVLCVIATAYSLDSLDTLIPGTIEEYFPFSVGVGKHFDLLEPNADGETRFSYEICTEKENVEGELWGAFKRTVFLGSMKIESQEVYAIGGNQVFLDFTMSMLGKKKFFERPIILKMPNTTEDIIEWSYHDDGDERSEHKCEAEYLPVLKTRRREFKHLIVVKKSSYLEGDLLTISKKFYARNYGLVRSESINPQNEELIMATSYEVSIID